MILPAGAADTTQTDPVLDSYEYFLEKGREKEDDLHKSYNDRSYLSSEEVGSGESRTGEWEELGLERNPSASVPACRKSQQSCIIYNRHCTSAEKGSSVRGQPR